MFLNHDRAFADFAPATQAALATNAERATATVTPDTWFETATGWTPVSTLQAGAKVRSFDGGFIALTHIAPHTRYSPGR